MLKRLKDRIHTYIFTPSLKASSSSRLQLNLFLYLHNLFGFGRVMKESIIFFGLGRCNLFELFEYSSLWDSDESFHCTDSNHQFLIFQKSKFNKRFACTK